MKAMICRKWGDPEDLRLEDVEPQPLKPGQVRIAVRAAGVSFATSLVIAGKYQRRPPFPFAPGTEVSGVITEVDAACKRLKLGDEVVAVLGENRLGVKLHTFDVEDAMAHTHHDAIGTACSDRQDVGNRLRIERQRVVARCSER